MSKQEKLLWTFFTGILILLYLLSSTDLIIKEKKTEIYPVSVIIDDTSDDYYVNFRKGVDKAADEYNVDVNFITMYEKGDAGEQMDLVKREMDDGAGAVVLAPANPIECARRLDEMVLNSPLIVVGNMFPNDKVRNGISPDYYESGKKLGEHIVEEVDSSIPIYVFSEGLEYGYDREVYESLFSVLDKSGFAVTVYQKTSEDTFRHVIEETVYPGSGEAVIVALDMPSLDAAVDILSGSQVYDKYIVGLYGMGSTTRILNQMDKGIIKGLVINNQFEIGYLSIEKAVGAINKNSEREQLIMESYYIEKNNIRESRFEKILYPID